MANRDPRVSAIVAIVDRLRDIGDYDAARQMQAEANRIRIAAEGLDAVNSNRSPLDTPAAHALKVAKLARTFDKQVIASLNSCMGILQRSQQDLDRRIASKANLKADDFAPEIRTAFRALDNEAKSKLMSKLIDERRGPELAAIVEAPSVLTGLADDRKARYRDAFISKHAAAELAERECLHNVFETVSAASRSAEMFVRELTDPQKLAEIERGAAAAEAAGEAFAQSLQ